MEMLWKELLAWATTGEDDQLEDDRAAELHCYFLRDKKIFDGRGNVESHHPRDGLLEERAGRAASDPTKSTQASPTRWVRTFGLKWCT